MRKKKKHDDHIDESWLIPYADILTLLLALFIVLFAASSVDSVKYQRIVESFNGSFGGQGIMDHPNQLQPESNSIVTDDQQQRSEAMNERKELEEIKQRIDAYINENNLDLHLETKLTKDGLLITILDHALFDSGSAEIKPSARQLAIEISNLLVTDPPRKVSVSGHTDNVPINNEQFRSNWDLSAMRAVNFVKLLLTNNELDPKDFNAIGHGEHQSVTTNEMESGRAQNRRVEVLILPNTSLELQQ